MSLAHPVLKDMLNSGCSDHTNVLIAFQTYMELCEVHNFKAVEHFFSTDINMIYLKGVQDKEEEIFLPISVKECITPSWIENVRKTICQNENGEKILNLVIRDSDTTCAIYKVSNGLKAPLSPESSRKKKTEYEKNQLIQSEIMKVLPDVYQKALEQSNK